MIVQVITDIKNDLTVEAIGQRYIHIYIKGNNNCKINDMYMYVIIRILGEIYAFVLNNDTAMS
jgi:hypothetical protein